MLQLPTLYWAAMVSLPAGAVSPPAPSSPAPLSPAAPSTRANTHPAPEHYSHSSSAEQARILPYLRFMPAPKQTIKQYLKASTAVDPRDCHCNDRHPFPPPALAATLQ